MWVVFVAWVVLIFLYPLKSVNYWVKDLCNHTLATFLGIEGAVFLIFSGPILVIAFLSIPYLIISRKQQLHHHEKKNSGKYGWSHRLSTFPVLVDGPFGVVSAAEVIGILSVIVFVIWAVFVYALRDLTILEETELTNKTKISYMLEISALSVGLIGIFCVAFLFVPISRGSFLLRLIDVPFGHAVRYHIWLGHLTMIFFTLHGLLYIIAWTMDGTLLQNILEWPESGVANLAGFIGLVAGLLIWVTSIPPVRKHYFEVFYYTHHLYIIFVIFLAMHVGVIFFSIVAGSIFLFMLDRLLRFCQSRNTVDIVSATCFPSGILKLVLSKPKHLQYNALSFIFLRVKEVSRLQWHPFSVSSSSLDGDQIHLSVFIRALGGWTTKINENFSSISRADESLEDQLHLHPHINVEGPYDHELPHHLMYENIILIAGGVGIAPFLAVLSDIFHHMKQGKPCLLKHILLVWAVKRSNDLSLLSTTDMNVIHSNLSNEVKLEFHVYITQESEPPSEAESRLDDNAIKSFAFPVANRRNMLSGLVGAGNNIILPGIYLITTTIGFLILVGSLNTFYINTNNIPIGWFHGILYLACMAASVFIFGGSVIGLWHLWESKFSQMSCDQDLCQHYNEPEIETRKDLCEYLASSTTIQYGIRPNFKDILESIQGHINVGVIVCGPPSLESNVAKQCRSLNMRRKIHHTIFHFHTHNFHL
ncbi:hypothetical protein LWI29_008213 [Acer saccharum]|uniref:FAD-binding FR-type domain-containing protein n=1 Tax=Acer saccharum TaxID=4024 RepID=A0AA39SC27_ACESA|nr:hypothetical protein LWI29_008213 [Acer saccharum]